MTILWCGNEDIDFPLGVIGTYPLMSQSFPGGSVSSAWILFNIRQFHTGGFEVWYCGLRDVATGKGVFVSNYSSDWSKLHIHTWDGTTRTSIAEESGGSIPWPGDIRLDLHVTPTNVELWLGGSLKIIDQAVDLSTYGISSFDGVFLGNSLYNWHYGYGPIVVADEDTRLFVVQTLRPNAEGDLSTNWTGAYTDIDETTLSDSDKIYSSTADADFQCNLTGMPTGTFAVKAVKIAARCVDGSGSKGVALGVKSGGTVNVGDTETCSGYWQTKERLMQVNPVTGVAFTPSDIEALQINLRAKAL